MLCTRCLRTLDSQHDIIVHLLSNGCGLPSHIAKIITSFAYPHHCRVTGHVSPDVPHLQMSVGYCAPKRQPWLKCTRHENGMLTTEARVCKQCLIEIIHHALILQGGQANEGSVYLNSSDFLYFKHDSFVQPGSSEICIWKSSVPAMIELAMFPTPPSLGSVVYFQDRECLVPSSRCSVKDGQVNTRIPFIFKKK